MVLALDTADHRPELEFDSDFSRFLRTLPFKENTVRAFDHTDFFSVHGEDARTAAAELYGTQNVLKLSSTTPSLTLSKLVFQKYVQLCLCEKGRRIEIWHGNRTTGWKLSREGSPGNVQALHGLLPSVELESFILLSLQILDTTEGFTLGCCFADIEKRRIGMTQFVENETFSNLESLLIQLGIKECLLSSSILEHPQMTKIRAILDRCNVVGTFCAKADFVDQSLTKSVPEIFESSVPATLVTQNRLSWPAASALIKYASLSPLAGSDLFTWWKFDLSTCMRLDGSAVKALSLAPSAQDGANKNMNLFGLLNQCRTPLGSRLLAQWLKQPLLDTHEIEDRHALVECFIKQSAMREVLQTELKLIPDLVRLAGRFRKGHASLEDVIRAHQVTCRIPEIISALTEDDLEDIEAEQLRKAYLDQLEQSDRLLAKFLDLVETTIDLNALDRHEYLIRADFDESLGILRQKINETYAKIEAEHQRVANDLDTEIDKKLKLENHTSFGYCLRLSRVEAAIIRNKSTYKELQTAKAGVYFTTSNLLNLAKDYGDANAQYTKHQSGLVREVVTIAASYCPVFEALGATIAHLDVMLSFAQVSLTAPTVYTRPKMHSLGTGNTILIGARHPCIEAQDDIRFIPNDISLIRGEAEFLIITGANMGGKSTYIRQVGVIVLMAQIGCFVPCDSAEVSICDAILARVGAGDSQLKGISTFMSECLETNSILETASKSSLIIIDELGRGTSTTDGFGLAYAISDHIVKQIGCFALFATHFHELTSLSDSVPVVKNLHVATHLEKTAEGSSITLLHRIVDGSCNQSFGIHVAELARFPESVVNMSKRKLEDLEHSSGVSCNDHAKKERFDYDSMSKIFGELPSEPQDAVKKLRELLQQQV